MSADGMNETMLAVKAKLQPWREIVIFVNQLLVWEKPFFPAIIAGATTLIYLILYCMDMSNLTLFTLLAAELLIVDFGVPFVAPKVFDPSKWTAKQEKEFETICECLSKASHELSVACNSLCEAKEKSPKLFLVASVTVLFVLSWLGTLLNGFFAAWCATLSVLMIPGLKKNGVLDKVIQLVMSKAKMQ